MSANPPGEKFTGPFGTYWFDDDGILNSSSNSVRRTLEAARENIALIKRMTQNRPVCLLVHVKYSPKPDRATRDLVSKELPNLYKAMAMVSPSGVGKLIMTVLFALKPPPIPMKTFSNELAAKKWLQKFL